MSQQFTFFWGSSSPFSNWYLQSFSHQGIQFNCSEQYMMYKKALLFNDIEVAELILEQVEPRKQKFLGRQVRGFDNDIWMAECRGIMVPGLVSKFMQDDYSHDCIIKSGKSILVEASPYDKVWGIGMTCDDPRATDPAQWEGLNLLGEVLMESRDIIMSYD